ncbi:hypothetical protein B0H19DRAFT_1271698 [Mycena capillaripes]|nr:hypothetical protein B0H19DRAFT_1271698 [Mycena capillaripes]
MDQALAHIDHPCYREIAGDVYVVCRVVRIFDDQLGIWVNALDVKSGRAIDVTNRQCDYCDKCRGVEFIWFWRYTSTTVKLLERLVHLTLRDRGAALAPYPCPGCGVKHQEFYSYEAAGGVEGVCEIIEFWLGALRQRVEKIPIKPVS